MGHAVRLAHARAAHARLGPGRDPRPDAIALIIDDARRPETPPGRRASPQPHIRLTRIRIVWKRATERLRQDPAFGPIVERVGPVRLRPARGDAFASLAASICYQQLAGKAALTIHGRFVAALDDEVTPERVLATPEETLRAAGLSRAKLAAIRDLAARNISGEVPLDALDGMENDEVIASLTRVRGVGVWTAQMYLMFDLTRPDVWPTGDLGVRAGLGKVLGWAAPPNPRETELIGIGYRPFRSALAWYCWRALEA